MKKNFKLFISFYLIFLVVGVSCDDNCGPFDDKFNVTNLIWRIPVDANTPVNFQEFSIDIRPEGSYFRSSEIASLSFISKSYACDPVPPDTDNLLLNLEITGNKDFNPSYTQGENLIDLFNIDVTYYRAGTQNQYSLSDFLSTNRPFPDEMKLSLKEAPSSNNPIAFTLKFYLDGPELNFFEFNTDAFIIE